MSKENNQQNKIVLFQDKKIRRVWYGDEWWFAVVDVVGVLTDSVDVKQYVKRMRQRDEELNSYWGTICTPLEMIARDGKKRKIITSNVEGLFRIIQSIPSPKAEPFKRWLAKVGYERVQEIENPELAQERMKKIYKQKGYPKGWIDKRLRGIAVRQTLTDEWQERGAKKGIEYAILTNEIMEGTFGMDVARYKEFKNLQRENLRDHMMDLELILTMLGEATTTKLTTGRNSKGFKKLKKDAKDGGKVAGRTRKDIERVSKKKVISKKNYLGVTGKNNKLIK